MTMRRGAALVAALLLLLAASACGARTVDVDQLAGELLERVAFEDELTELGATDEHALVLDALMALPEKFRLVLTLHYVEGYSTSEIAGMIGRTPSAVKMRLQKGRRLLEDTLGKE